MRTRNPSLLVMAAAGAVALGACSPAESGAAAVVGDRRITTGQLQRALDTLRAGNPDFAQVKQLDRLVLFDLIAEPYLVQAAQDAGLGVSTSEAQAALPKAPGANADALRALRAQIALNRLDRGQKRTALDSVAAGLRREGVRVSPRFGRFDSTKMTIVDAAPNWLVAGPVASPTDLPSSAP